MSDHAEHVIDCPTAQREQTFDCDPTTSGEVSADGLIQHGRSCNLCRAPITPLSDYGFWDFSNIEDDGDEPDWVPLCWAHVRQWMYDESDVVDPKTGRRATDGLEVV